MDSLESIAEAYPRLFTERRFHEWARLFDPNGVVARGGAHGTSWVKPIAGSLQDQKRFAQGRSTLSETWDDIETFQWGSVGLISAAYELTADDDRRRGRDIALAIKCEAGWRIVALAYEEY